MSKPAPYVPRPPGRPLKGAVPKKVYSFTLSAVQIEQLRLITAEESEKHGVNFSLSEIVDLIIGEYVERYRSEEGDQDEA